ncbi:MAG: ATP-binding cassette domain-containing protein [Planctomycetes bacterium]|nr:ATP-binding cassette domain-containing protein [Planctomycetota bacterium]
MEQPHVFQLENLAKSYGGREVLRIPDLTIRRGEVFCVVGPSGSGKSTLLRLLNFLEPPTNGRVLFGGYSSNGRGFPPLEVQRRVAMVFQRPVLLNTTVRANVAYGLRLRGERNVHDKVRKVLDDLGLTPLADQPARLLSGGEYQRVAFARALVLDLEVLLLDEPTAHLDPSNVALIEEMIRRTNRKHGMTVVLVTHNVFQAKRLAHRLALLLDGQLVEVSDSHTFFDSPRDPRTAGFVSGQMVY